jgi:hypothetical protein
MIDTDTMALGVIGLLAVGLIAVARRSRWGSGLPGSFGQGFIGFRGDGWPHGVQEDDDAHWAWPGSRPAAASAAPSARTLVTGGRAIPPSRPQR